MVPGVLRFRVLSRVEGLPFESGDILDRPTCWERGGAAEWL